ncbi:hypothetical protein RJ55_03684 [Drechmeria coniospora]|nr:hypothetical protein RJ55_03684 [Drechmeria coniospora]
MKANIFSLVALIAVGAFALPTAKVDDELDASMPFFCPDSIDEFCHQASIRLGCTHDGDFRSHAQDLCGSCHCILW